MTDTLPSRPRFSLLTLVLLTTIVAFFLVVVLQYRELMPLRVENRRLRLEVGELTIDDPSMINAISVKRAGGYRWEWRLYLPEGRDYWVHLSRRVPVDGLPVKPNSIASLGIGGREVTLIAEVLPTETGERYLYLRSDLLNSPYLMVDESDWLNGRTMVETSIAGENEQVSGKTNAPLVLLRLESDKRGKPANYDEGLLIWLSTSR